MTDQRTQAKFCALYRRAKAALDEYSFPLNPTYNAWNIFLWRRFT